MSTEAELKEWAKEGSIMLVYHQLYDHIKSTNYKIMLNSLMELWAAEKQPRYRFVLEEE